MSYRGRISYSDCLAEMEERREAILAGDASRAHLILCEHEAIVTRGRSSQDAHLLLPREELTRRGIDLVDIGRGGDVTYHGPGQLMVYPIVSIGVRVSAFLAALAEGLAEVANSYGVAGARWRRDQAGLWLGERKLAACGLHVRRGVSIHGFALNVCTPPEAWHCIVPCGLSGPGPVSLLEAMAADAHKPTVAEVAARTQPILLNLLARYGLDPASEAPLP